MEAATFGDKLFTGTLIFLTILAILVLFAVRNFGHGLLLLKHETYEHSGNYNWLYKTRPFVIFIWNRSEWKNKVKLLKKCLFIRPRGVGSQGQWHTTVFDIQIWHQIFRIHFFISAAHTFSEEFRRGLIWNLQKYVLLGSRNPQKRP